MNKHYYLLSSLRSNIRPSVVSRSRLPTQYTFETGTRFRKLSAMATATHIQLSPTTDSGIYSSNVREDSARTASELLQEDMAKHHVFFNDQGFHNHIPHQLLSIYALGATPEQIKAGYQRNEGYQRPARPADQEVILSMRDSVEFQKYLGREKHYPNYLAFFQQEIDSKGVGETLKGYLFAGDERAESMLCRLFGGACCLTSPTLYAPMLTSEYLGLIHPLIHLSFGLEFNQPAIVAQGLAQAAVHADWIGREFFLPAEKQAGGIGKQGQKTLLQLLNEIRADKALVESVQWKDENKIRDGVLTRAPGAMLTYAAQYTVSEDQVDERLADMINTVVYYTSTAQRPSRAMKLDFFFIHCLNSSIFFSKIMKLPILDQRSKLRLLEWKGRMDLLMYTSRGTPDLLLEEVARYPAKENWSQIFARSVAHPGDDGHLAKLTRALAHGQKVCEPYESSNPEMPIRGDVWLRIGNIAVDSTVEEGKPMWVRSTGFDEAWEPEGSRL
ncbi:unnamed protein product [Penicillium olsonii]|nr:unnamed protein product [Penicillium olsonii]CAG7925253.1 unnamed protein product [Penicillium olsonii]